MFGNDGSWGSWESVVGGDVTGERRRHSVSRLSGTRVGDERRRSTSTSGDTSRAGPSRRQDGLQIPLQGGFTNLLNDPNNVYRPQIITDTQDPYLQARDEYRNFVDPDNFNRMLFDTTSFSQSTRESFVPLQTLPVHQFHLQTQYRPSGSDLVRESQPSRPSLSQRPLRSHSSQQRSHSFRPSGGDLRTRSGVPPHSLEIPPDIHPNVSSLKEKDGRGQTAPSAEISEYSRRSIISKRPLRNDFSEKKAKKDISALLRQHYKGEFYWKEVSMDQRKFLWEQFGMRYRWDRDSDQEIQEVCEWLCHDLFMRMLNDAKDLWANGNGHKAKWLLPHHWRHLVYDHWMTPEQQAIVDRHRTNRGTKSTYYGGTRGTIEYQDLLEHQLSQSSDGGSSRGSSVLSSPNILKAAKSKDGGMYFRKLLGKGKKKKNPDEEVVEEDDIVPNRDEVDLEITDEEWRWTRYYDLLDQNYRSNLSDKPGPNDDVDLNCWVRAGNGPHHGRIWAIGAGVRINEHGLSGGHGPQSQVVVDEQPVRERVMNIVADVVRNFPGLTPEQADGLIAQFKSAEKARRYGETGKYQDRRTPSPDDDDD